eukprot:COSAG04_NODE_20525_length_391_cov_1.578767_1_plen_91_part_01
MHSGTLPWTAAHDRLTLFYKFSPHGVAHNATFFNSEQFRSMCTYTAIYRLLSLSRPGVVTRNGLRSDPEMTERELATLEPPAAYRRSGEAD